MAQLTPEELREAAVDKVLQNQQRVIVDHIAELLGRIDMDPKIFDIKRNLHRLLSAENQTHNVTSWRTTASVFGNSSPNPGL